MQTFVTRARANKNAHTLNLDLSITTRARAVRPLFVEISTKREHISAGRKLEVICVTAGSRPPAQVTWTKNKKRLEHSRYETGYQSNPHHRDI